MNLPSKFYCGCGACRRWRAWFHAAAWLIILALSTLNLIFPSLPMLILTSAASLIFGILSGYVAGSATGTKVGFIKGFDKKFHLTLQQIFSQAQQQQSPAENPNPLDDPDWWKK